VDSASSEVARHPYAIWRALSSPPDASGLAAMTDTRRYGGECPTFLGVMQREGTHPTKEVPCISVLELWCSYC
jgi:hypothetical protein